MPEEQPRTSRRRSAIFFVITVFAATVVAVGSMALFTNILQHKQEAKNPFFRVVELDDKTTDPSVWGKNFPLQYDDYLRTVDQVRTRYGGSEALPRTPTDADPRSIVAQSRLEEDLRLKIMWAGYAFAREFREERGHAFMLADQTYTERQIAAQQPGTCLHCHASVYAPYKELGNCNVIAGFEAMNKMTFADARKMVTHPVSCLDCHDPQTMQLRITRPGFIEGIAALKESQGVKDFDVNKMATRQEMRTYVCAQCHVEYYF
jgi:nitrite reductase (cytochrome c-552)